MLKNQEITSKNQEASIRNLERQIGQLSKQAVIERPTSSLPSDTIPNPKEEYKAIQLRSGRTLGDDKEANKKPMESDKIINKKDEANSKEEMTASKQAQEKLKEKDDQPQDPRKRKQTCSGRKKPTRHSLISFQSNRQATRQAKRRMRLHRMMRRSKKEVRC
ncbi:hypothetical protein AHAS_Ahas11G0145200 [Arachis hypogaea]